MIATHIPRPDRFLSRDSHPTSSKFDLFEAFTKKIVDAVKSKPKLWAHTAVFITVCDGDGKPLVLLPVFGNPSKPLAQQYASCASPTPLEQVFAKLKNTFLAPSGGDDAQVRDRAMLVTWRAES